MSVAERFTGLSWRDNGPIVLVSLGHAATHWVGSTFYILLPSIALSLGLNYVQTGALVSIMQVSSFAANFVSGPLTDMSGRRIIFQLIALCLGGAALAMLGIVDGFPLIAAMAGIMGATQNFWHPPAISFLSSRYAKQRGYALSIHGLGASLGDTVAPLVAGALIATMTWHAAAISSVAPVFVIALLLGACLLPGERPVQGGTAKRGMSAAEYLSGMAVMVKTPGVLMLCVTAGFRTMTQSGLQVFLPLYLANELGVSPFMMGATMALMQAGGLVATPIAGVWSDRVGRRKVVVAGLSVSTVVVGSLTFLGNEAAFIAGVSLLGFALYAIRPVVQSWMMDMTPQGMGGSSTSLMFGTQSAFTVAMPVVGGMIADTWGLSAVFYVLAGTVLISNLLTMRLPEERRER